MPPRVTRSIATIIREGNTLALTISLVLRRFIIPSLSPIFFRANIFRRVKYFSSRLPEAS